jgi:predicted HicB family RNase H-like nuclease
MKDVLVYKDYRGSVHFDADDKLVFGKIEGIEDLVSFEGDSVIELNKAFEEAVNDYLEICKDNGEKT